MNFSQEKAPLLDEKMSFPSVRPIIRPQEVHPRTRAEWILQRLGTDVVVFDPKIEVSFALKNLTQMMHLNRINMEKQTNIKKDFWSTEELWFERQLWGLITFVVPKLNSPIGPTKYFSLAEACDPLQLQCDESELGFVSKRLQKIQQVMKCVNDTFYLLKGQALNSCRILRAKSWSFSDLRVFEVFHLMFWISIFKNINIQTNIYQPTKARQKGHKTHTHTHTPNRSPPRSWAFWPTRPSSDCWIARKFTRAQNTRRGKKDMKDEHDVVLKGS